MHNFSVKYCLSLPGSFDHLWTRC